MCVCYEGGRREEGTLAYLFCISHAMTLDIFACMYVSACFLGCVVALDLLKVHVLKFICHLEFLLIDSFK